MSSSTLMFLHAITSLHPGAGTALGVVDLPIQRERHTGWPLIPGSSLKGVLREACRAAESRKEMKKQGKQEPFAWNDWCEASKKADKTPELICAFGTAMGDTDKDVPAGSLAVGDARILFFPVRSIRGLFAWVTCPGALTRFKRDAQLAGSQAASGIPDIVLDPQKETAAVVANDSKNKFPSAQSGAPNLVLEDMDFMATEKAEVAQLAKKIPVDVPDFAQRIVILNDDFFTFFVRNATEVSARIALEYGTKTVREGALFYQEFLPPETVMYAPLMAEVPRSNGKTSPPPFQTSDALIQHVSKQTKTGDGQGPLQIGGDASTGKGLCRVSYLS